MNKIHDWVGGIKIGVGIAMLVTIVGCVGYVGPDGGEVGVAGPDVTIFGGGFDRGHVVHDYGHRGFVSRGIAHGGGGFRGGRR
jgi:hypothetical protein